MKQIPYADDKHSNYENFYATCPYCGFKNIFNRVTDLGTTSLITCKTVRCLNEKCSNEFNINGDKANAAFEMLIYDCYDLIRGKQYSYCILNLAQAYEVFFALFININLIYRPYNPENDTIDDLNLALEELYAVTKKCTYYPMRNIFFNLIINKVAPASLADARTLIKNLPNMGSNLPIEAFNKIENDELKSVILSMEASDISNLRNDVVHKMAYRPSLREVEKALEETRSNLFKASKILGVLGDNLNRYLYN